MAARWVIHTVGPVYGGWRTPPVAAFVPRRVAQSRRRTGRAQRGIPAIYAGIYGYPVEEAARVAIAAVLEAGSRVEDVSFVLFSKRAYRMFRHALAEALERAREDGSGD